MYHVNLHELTNFHYDYTLRYAFWEKGLHFGKKCTECHCDLNSGRNQKLKK